MTLKRTMMPSLVQGRFPAEPATSLTARAGLRLRAALGTRTGRATTPPSLKIADILPEELVIPALSGHSKEEVLRELVGYMAGRLPEVDPKRLLEVVWERERFRSTALGGGIAIPHGTLPGLGAPVRGAFGRHLRGVDFQSSDGTPTKLFFLLVASEATAGRHFYMLARISRLLKDEASRERLLAAPDRSELYRSIRQEDEKH